MPAVEPEARYKLVGAIILGLALATAGAFVWLSRTGVASDFRFYTIYFERQSLEGLQVGGDVSMHGVKVGRVEGFSLERENINRVRVMVRVGRHTPVSTNTVAVIGRNLVTGIARVNLETPPPPGPELTETPPGEAYPVIPEGTSDLQQIAETANSAVILADSVLRSLNSVLSEENRKNFSELLVSLRTLSTGLHQRLGALDATNAALHEAARSFAKANEQVGTLAARVNDRVEPVSTEAVTTLRDTQAMLREMQSTLRTLAEVSRSLERDATTLTRRTDDTVETGALELRATARELRVGVEQLSRTLDRLQEPRSALFGPGQRQLGPGERPR